MKLFNLFLMCSTLLLVGNAKADDIEKSQAEYDKQVAESLQEMTSQLQMMSNEMVKYMNAMNKALSESMPQMTEDLNKVISSMKPLAETMQKNVEAFGKEMEEQLNIQEDSISENQSEKTIPTKPQLAISTFTPPEQVILPTSESQDISTAIDAELAQFEPIPVPQKKIKLFPSSVE